MAATINGKPLARLLYPYRWFRSHGRDGIIRVVKHPYFWLRYYPARRRYARFLAPIFEENAAFDLRHGVNTASGAALINLEVDAASWTHGTNYGALSESLFRKCMAALEQENTSAYTFLDLGSGKGKVLLLAASLPFREIVGVEFAPELVAIADENKRIFLQRNADLACRQITNVCMDAGAFEFPETPLVLFLFNPFDDTIMARVADNLEHSQAKSSRDIWVIYANPRFADVFRERSSFSEIVRHDEYVVFRSVQVGASLSPGD